MAGAVLVIGVALAGLALLVVAVMSGISPAQPSPSSPTGPTSAASSLELTPAPATPTESAVRGETQVPIEADTTHVGEGQSISYTTSPPTSGRHYTRTAPYAVADVATAPGYWVHNLEHGGIAVLFRCASDCAVIADELRSTLMPRVPPSKFGAPKLLATPADGLSSAFAVVAWGWILELNALDVEAILGFYGRHVDQGPEDVP